MTHRTGGAEGPASPARGTTTGLSLFDPPSGDVRKAEALAGHEARSGVVLAQLRAAMLALFKQREATWPRGTAYVTADNVAAWHDAHGHPKIEGRGCYGAVFKAKGWVQVGWGKSDPIARKTNKSADIRKWAYREDET